LERVDVIDPGDRPDRFAEENGPATGQAIVGAAAGVRVRAVIGIDDLGLHQQVLDHLGRDPRIEVVATLTDLESARFGAGDWAGCVLVATVEMAATVVGSPSAPPAGLVIVNHDLDVPTLRSAISLGAVGAFAWPSEREQLARQVRRCRPPASSAIDEAPGRVVSVVGTRGGVGATFVATHLSAALADGGIQTVLVDADASYSDVTAALGLSGRAARTIADLAPVRDELSGEHLAQVLVRHDRGFDALLGPASEMDLGRDRSGAAWPGVLRDSIGLLAESHGAVVVHVPHALDESALAAVEASGEALVVASLDIFSFYGARRAVATLGLDSGRISWRLVVNRGGPGGLRICDVEPVLGRRPDAVIRSDPSVRRAYAGAELLAARSNRAMKDVRRLAASLVSAPQERGRP
jgi:MinD-like ATPase involved in chromosome partitioning or flagellar assembly